MKMHPLTSGSSGVIPIKWQVNRYINSTQQICINMDLSITINMLHCHLLYVTLSDSSMNVDYVEYEELIIKYMYMHHTTLSSTYILMLILLILLYNRKMCQFYNFLMPVAASKLFFGSDSCFASWGT